MAYSTAYYQAHKEAYKCANRRYYRAHKKEHSDRGRIWVRQNKDKARQAKRDCDRRLRAAVLAYLGNKCLLCGFLDSRALQVDHVFGGGCQEIKALGSRRIYHKILSGAYDDRYQLLCANCNQIKKAENKEI